MISLLGTLLGFTTSVIPEILGYFKQKQANAQELAMLEAKSKYAQELSRLKIEETKGLYAHDSGIDAGGFVNGLRGSVRPVITYLFFALFAAVKGTLIYALIANQNVEWTVAIQSAWDQETQAIFSAILAFWFGHRGMSKSRAYFKDK